MAIALLLSLLLAQGTTTSKPAPQPQPTTPPKTAPAPPKTTPAPAPRTQTPRQPGPGAVGGIALTATDGKGAPFTDVSVELTGAGVPARTEKTDSAGQTGFPSLRAGTYRLRFTGEGVVAFEREVTVRAGTIEKLPITLTAAEPPKVVAPPPAAAAAPPRAVVGPVGQPQVVSIIDLVEKELIRGNQPRKDSLIACSGNTRTMLVQLNDPQAQRMYTDAEVTYYVVAGEGAINVDGRDTRLNAGGYAAMPRGTRHSITRSGRRPLILLATLSGEPCEEAK